MARSDDGKLPATIPTCYAIPLLIYAIGRGQASGTDFATHTLSNSVSIAKLDFADRVIEQIAATRASTSDRFARALVWLQ